MGRLCRGCGRGCSVFPSPANQQCITMRAIGDQARLQRTPYRCYQVWSHGRKGVKGSQNWYRLVCHRGRKEVKWWCGGSRNRELQWKEERRADISNAEKRWVFYVEKGDGDWRRQNKWRQQGPAWGARTYPSSRRLRRAASHGGQ